MEKMKAIEVLKLARRQLYSDAECNAKLYVDTQQKYKAGYAQAIMDCHSKIEWCDKMINQLSRGNDEENV